MNCISYTPIFLSTIILSFSNALVTLGRIEDIGKKRVTDRIVLIIWAMLALVMSIVITTTHAKIFQL